MARQYHKWNMKEMKALSDTAIDSGPYEACKNYPNIKPKSLAHRMYQYGFIEAGTILTRYSNELNSLTSVKSNRCSKIKLAYDLWIRGETSWNIIAEKTGFKSGLSCMERMVAYLRSCGRPTT